MRFQSTGSFKEGVADVDPVAAPATILTDHLFTFKKYVTTSPTKLILCLAGAGAETVTVDLYALLEDLEEGAVPSDYATTTARWYRFATGEVITNGALSLVTASLPAGGTIYVRRTADTIGAGLTRKLHAAWA